MKKLIWHNGRDICYYPSLRLHWAEKLKKWFNFEDSKRDIVQRDIEALRIFLPLFLRIFCLKCHRCSLWCGIRKTWRTFCWLTVLINVYSVVRKCRSGYISKEKWVLTLTASSPFLCIWLIQIIIQRFASNK